jgi:hypothetical protein
MESSVQLLRKKQQFMQDTIQNLDDWIADCERYKEQFSPDKMEEEGANPTDAIHEICKKVADSKLDVKFTQGQKEFHATINKVGKAIDKEAESEVTKLYQGLDLHKEQLQSLIAQHMFREGRFQLGETFLKEAHIQIPDEMKKPFIELYKILESIQGGNIDLALDWAKSKRRELDAIGSTIEFQFHKLQFSNFLRNGKSMEALDYARKHFTHFVKKELREIQRLMGSLVYCKDLENSPYRDLHSSLADIDLRSQFARDYCRLLGLPPDSALYTCVTAGSSALPILVKASVLMSKADWDSGDVLPVEIDPKELEAPSPTQANKSFVYHSIFSCPVSKEQSSPTNPPVRLPCGHVLCKLSMERLIRASTQRFKCPYCPTEGTADDVQIASMIK